MTKKTHRCDESCTHPPKRKMGTSKKKKSTKSTKIIDKPKLPKGSLADDVISPESWVNTVAATMGIPSNATKDPVFKEAEELYAEILKSDNDYAIQKAKTLVDDLRMKLVNLKRDNLG